MERNAVDREFAGEHGTTALPESIEEEEHPEIDPQTPAGAMRKAAAEAGQGEGRPDKLKRVGEEADGFLGAPHLGGDNLFIADGSVCPTQGSANPALTIMALASRLASRLA